MVVSRFAQVLDQSIMERKKEIVRAGGAVMLLRVEPARRDVGVPRQNYFTARCGRVGCPHPPKEGHGQAARRHCRRLKHPAPGQPRSWHRRLRLFLGSFFDEPCTDFKSAMQTSLAR